MAKRPEKFLFHDPALCMGCHSCEIACKLEHDLPAGVNRVRMVTEGPKMVDGELELHYDRIGCMHCARPPCINACPTSAIKKRPDGIVQIDESRCTGCQTCAEVCPYDAIEFHPEKNWAELCDLCAHRLDDELLPFCVKHCLSGALFYGTGEEFKQRLEKVAARGGKAR